MKQIDIYQNDKEIYASLDVLIKNTSLNALNLVCLPHCFI